MNMMTMGLLARGHGLVLPSTYDPQLVALSVLVASIAAYTALTLAERVTVAQGRLRLLWLLGGATALGTGIWAMHFTGMLAFTLPIPVSYDVPLVAVSLLVAIAASGSALFIVSRRAMGARAWLVGGLLLGGGVATMHYTGMAAMRMAALTHWDLRLVGLSVLVAVRPHAS
jgi:methyl-accepting chemotaxis protein PixJ